MTFHRLILTISCNVRKYSFMHAVGSAETDPESTKMLTYAIFS